MLPYFRLAISPSQSRILQKMTSPSREVLHHSVRSRSFRLLSAAYGDYRTTLSRFDLAEEPFRAKHEPFVRVMPLTATTIIPVAPGLFFSGGFSRTSRFDSLLRGKENLTSSFGSSENSGFCLPFAMEV